jgi:hypothetical protein
MEHDLPSDPSVLKQRVKDIWEQNADHWDQGMGDPMVGTLTQRFAGPFCGRQTRRSA